MRIGRFLEIHTELLNVLNEYPTVYQTIINQIAQTLGVTLSCAAYFDLEASRDPGSWYKNTSNCVLIVAVQCQAAVAAEGAELKGVAELYGYLSLVEGGEDNDPSALIVGINALWLRGLDAVEAHQLITNATLIIVVPPGYWYMVETSEADSGSLNIQHWHEFDIGAMPV